MPHYSLRITYGDENRTWSGEAQPYKDIQAAWNDFSDFLYEMDEYEPNDWIFLDTPYNILYIKKSDIKDCEIVEDIEQNEKYLYLEMEIDRLEARLKDEKEKRNQLERIFGVKVEEDGRIHNV